MRARTGPHNGLAETGKEHVMQENSEMLRLRTYMEVGEWIAEGGPRHRREQALWQEVNARRVRDGVEPADDRHHGYHRSWGQLVSLRELRDEFAETLDPGALDDILKEAVPDRNGFVSVDAALERAFGAWLDGCDGYGYHPRLRAGEHDPADIPSPDEYGTLMRDMFDLSMSSENGTWFVDADIIRDAGEHAGTTPDEQWDRFLADVDALRTRLGAQAVDPAISIEARDWRSVADGDEAAVLYGGFRDLFAGPPIDPAVIDGDDDGYGYDDADGWSWPDPWLPSARRA